MKLNIRKTVGKSLMAIRLTGYLVSMSSIANNVYHENKLIDNTKDRLLREEKPFVRVSDGMSVEERQKLHSYRTRNFYGMCGVVEFPIIFIFGSGLNKDKGVR